MPEKKYNFELFTDISNIAHDQWEIIETDSLFSTKQFLHFTAKNNPQIIHRWIIVKENNTCIAGLYFQLVYFKGNQLKSYMPDSGKSIINTAMQGMVDCFLDKVHWKLAVLGNIFVTGDNGQYWTKKIKTEERWQILKKALKKLSDTENVDAILLTDIYNQDLKGSETLEKKGYRMFALEPDMILKISENWQTFQDYLQSVSSKYRVRAKKVLEKSAGLTILNAEVEDLKKHKERLYELYKNVIDKADFKLAEVLPDYLHQCKAAFPGKFYVKVYLKDNDPKGFISYFINYRSLEAHIIGIDYLCNRDDCVYQRILYDCIEEAIKHRKESVHFGRTAGLIKSAVGAKPVPVYSFLKHKNSLSNLAIKPLTEYLKPEPFEARNPYKKD